ncbi:hypothetical protein [Cytophaga sp. FL35]|uniref:hypothetical protein n=1 Tax=Cytophaga sp. FL35 TaxID=1904456 RepID=UPI001653E487|nr:hypothetical protein [Cytophaga sp. FL35]MBC6999908.1 hypothetical protein [Cytophaga sp. FL35]
MKYIYPKLLAVCLVVAIYCNNRSVKNYQTTSDGHGYHLIVKRGAFHKDRFDLYKNKIRYTPDTSERKADAKYNHYTETYLDSLPTIGFFKKLEAEGFWELDDHYPTGTSCPSQMIVTLKHDKKSKTVICGDFLNDCPDLIKYIDKKVVEMEGHDLHRIYTPG